MYIYTHTVYTLHTLNDAVLWSFVDRESPSHAHHVFLLCPNLHGIIQSCACFYVSPSFTNEIIISLEGKIQVLFIVEDHVFEYFPQNRHSINTC